MTSPRSDLPPVRRLEQGSLVNQTGYRDPLSVRLDAAADELVQAAIARQGSWVRRWIRSPQAEFANLDKGGLTHHERAFYQACCYHRRIYRHGVPYYVYDEAGIRYENPNPDRTHALKPRWDREPTIRRTGVNPGIGRILSVRAIPAGEASLYASGRYGR